MAACNATRGEPLTTARLDRLGLIVNLIFRIAGMALRGDFACVGWEDRMACRVGVPSAFRQL